MQAVFCRATVNAVFWFLGLNLDLRRAWHFDGRSICLYSCTSIICIWHTILYAYDIGYYMHMTYDIIYIWHIIYMVIIIIMINTIIVMICSSILQSRICTPLTFRYRIIRSSGPSLHALNLCSSGHVETSSHFLRKSQASWIVGFWIPHFGHWSSVYDRYWMMRLVLRSIQFLHVIFDFVRTFQVWVLQVDLKFRDVRLFEKQSVHRVNL